jgi:YbbR domain-containing protein
MKKNINIIFISIIFSVILWISISLSNEYYTSINVHLKIIDIPEGYTTASKLPDYVNIKLKGNGWRMAAASLGSEYEFTISAKNDSGKIFANLFSSLNENRKLTDESQIISISPDTVSFRIEKIASKKMKIIPRINITFKNGCGFAEPTYVYPESTIVYGPWSILKDMDHISTENISISNADSRINQKISLLDYRGLTYDINTAFIYINIQKIVDKNFDDLPVRINDIPNDRDVIFLPNKISIGVRGGVDILGKVTEDQFKISINYRNIVSDTLGSVMPNIETPKGLYLIYNKPERLRYIIKKY